MTIRAFAVAVMPSSAVTIEDRLRGGMVATFFGFVSVFKILKKGVEDGAKSKENVYQKTNISRGKDIKSNTPSLHFRRE